MLMWTVLDNPAHGNLSKFMNHLIAKAMNSLLHLQVEFTRFSGNIFHGKP
jgi:hypothetical protein